MATITELPDDCLNIILEYKVITVEDIMNLMSTCKRFHQMTLPNKFWEKKYYQSCPTAKRKYNNEKQNEIFNYIDFKKQNEEGIHCIQKVQHYLLVTYLKKLSDIDKMDLMNLLRSISENSMTFYFVWDEANRTKLKSKKFKHQSSKPFINLRHERIYNQIFDCLRYFRFIHKQMKFKKMQKRELLLEKQLTIVAQYFAPHVSYSAVKAWLDEITERILSRMKIKYPSHSICSTILEQFSFSKHNNIQDNFWNETESREIMSVLEEYMFSDLDIDELYKFLKLTDFEVNYMHNIEYNYIQDVRRRRLLIIMYHIIARRLGIHTLLIRYKNDSAIIWKPEYNTRRWINAEVFYINEDTYLIVPPIFIRASYLLPSMPFIGDVWMTISMIKFLYYSLITNEQHCERNLNFILRFLQQCRKSLNIEKIYKSIINTEIKG